MVKSEFGHADVLINNAGSNGPGGKIGEVNPSDWWADFDINVKGTFLVTQGFLKLLGIEKQGTIVTMSTGISYMVSAGMSAYSISKLADVRLSEYVSVEYLNVTAISLQPGVVKMDMVMVRQSARICWIKLITLQMTSPGLHTTRQNLLVGLLSGLQQMLRDFSQADSSQQFGRWTISWPGRTKSRVAMISSSYTRPRLGLISSSECIRSSAFKDGEFLRRILSDQDR